MAATQDKNLGYYIQLVIEKKLYVLAKLYLKIKHPKLIVTAGSIGKTSTKVMIGELLASERRVSYMAESYNSGIGLPLSVFGQQVPAHSTSPIAWLGIFFRCIGLFFRKAPEYMVLEYGIDHPGEMKRLLSLRVPDISLLSAITPEHMEFMKTIEAVAEEELQIVTATKKVSFVNFDDVEERFRPDSPKVKYYGSIQDLSYSYRIHSIGSDGAIVSFNLDGVLIGKFNTQIISEPLVRQLCGAAAIAHYAGVSPEALMQTLENMHSTNGRMRLLRGYNGSVLVDDTVNFSPTAGIAALRTLQSMQASRRIIAFGNQHELGDYAEQGFKDVAEHFKNIDLYVFVGELAKKYFVPEAIQNGAVLDKTLFIFDDAISAGEFLKPLLKKGDAVLIKGPFGGYYMEECTKRLLQNPEDAIQLVRQSAFWQNKKAQHFGNAYKV